MMSSSGKSPPRFIPTLTEVVQMPSTTAVHNRAAEVPALDSEAIISSVMQRIDETLDSRLQSAAQNIVRQHLNALVPLIEEEIQRVVREVVNDAVAAELSLPSS
jgi:FixJ family two-component response regulator